MALTAENLSSLLHDIETLSLEKYISEVVSAVVEGACKVRVSADIQAALQVISALHQRFTLQFTPFLAFNLVKNLAPPPSSVLNTLSAEQREKEEGSRIVKQRSLLRLVTELWLVNVLRTVQDAIDGSGAEVRRKRVEEALPFFCLRELLANDREFTNLSIAVTFIKNFSWILVPEVGNNEFMEPQESENLRLILKKYFELLGRHLERQNLSIVRGMSQLEESSLARGSISSSRETSLNDLQKLHEKQVASAQVLADNLHLEMPIFAASEESMNHGPSIIRGIGNLRPGEEIDGKQGIWEDEEQRRLYEVLIDLREVVPSDLLTDGKVRATDAGSIRADPMSSTTVPEVEPSYDDTDLEDDLTASDQTEEEPESSTTTVGARIGALLLRLPELSNRELIDSAAVEFAFLNSKASRNRLVKTLLNVPTSRIDILPYFARLIATLNEHLPTIGECVVEALHRDCRRYVKGRGLSKDIALRNCNIRYLSELVKFKIVPQHITFHCFRILVESFSKNDIEVLATMLENCGRFLLRTPDNFSKMQTVLEVISRKSKNVSGLERSVIENAFYYVNPPERMAIRQKERQPVELYIRKLVYTDLTNKNYDKILRQLKKLDWLAGQGDRYLYPIFTKVWKIRFASIQYLAILLSGLAKSQPVFAVNVIDCVIENIRVGLEENRFRDNQRRIATVKYLGELYNYKQIDAQLIFDSLYLLVTFGHPGGRPTSNGTLSDTPQDYFRIRLCLTLLDTCGNCFNQGASKKKLDLFLSFFQYYIQTKDALPLDIEFAVSDTLTILRPNLVVLTSLEVAAKALDEAIKNSVELPAEPAEQEPDDESDDNPDDDEEISERIARELEDSGDEDEHPQMNDDEEQQFVLLEKKRMQDDLDRQAEDELSRELSKLMSESNETRKQERNRPLDIALPRRQQTASSLAEQLPGTASLHPRRLDAGTEKQNAVAFTFLTKKGKSKSLNLPSNSALVISNIAQRAAELREKEAIKNLVIKYETAYGKEEIDQTAKKSGMGLKYTPQMLAGQKGGQRSGSMFRMGTQRQRKVDNPDED